MGLGGQQSVTRWRPWTGAGACAGGVFQFYSRRNVIIDEVKQPVCRGRGASIWASLSYLKWSNALKKGRLKLYILIIILLTLLSHSLYSYVGLAYSASLDASNKNAFVTTWAPSTVIKRHSWCPLLAVTPRASEILDVCLHSRANNKLTLIGLCIPIIALRWILA